MRDDVPTLAGCLASPQVRHRGVRGQLRLLRRETGLARGFAHYEDFPLGLFDAFTRYVAIGRRFDVPKTTSDIELFLEKHTGRWYDVLPRSKEHEKNADEINRAFLKWLGKRPANGRPFFAFLNYNDAHTPYEVPDPSIPALGRRPASASQRQTLRSFTGLDKFQLSVDDVRLATDVYDDSIFYMDKRLGAPRRTRSASRARRHARDRHLGPRRASGRSRAVLSRRQPVPSARAGSAGDGGEHADPAGGEGRRGDQPARSPGHGDRPARPRAGSIVQGSVGGSLLATTRWGGGESSASWPIRCSWRRRSRSCS